MSSAAHPPDDVSAVEAHSTSQLLNSDSVDQYRQAVLDGVERVATRIGQAESPATGIPVHELSAVVNGIDLDQPLGDSTAALDELERIYLRDAVYFHHPRYLAHLNCPVLVPALLGEAVLSAVNSSMDTWDQSAGGTLIEQRLIEWTAGRIGFGSSADGVFTSGGTQSNLQALLMAREEACRATRNRGDRRHIMARLRILTSQCGHFSVAKAASVLGLGEDAVISLPCDDDKRMRVDALAGELEKCRRSGLIVMAVVATAGTTDFGSIDPLSEIAKLCERAGVWMHVDAAYGCGLLVSRHRGFLDGVERADSVTVDYHKSFFQPVSSSAVIVRDREQLRHVTYHADYLNPAVRAGSGIPNQVDKSLQTTRRFDALKLWMSLRITGADAIGALFDAVIDLAQQVWTMLTSDSRFEVVARPCLSTLVFRCVPADASPDFLDELNDSVRDSLFGSGTAVVAATTVDGRRYLKMTLLNPSTSARDVAEILDLIAEHAEKILADHGVEPGRIWCLGVEQ